MNDFVQKFALRQKISDYARSIGFDLVGFSPAKIQEKYLSAFENWLKEGHAADMEYMQKIEQRRDMTKVLTGAKSVIVLAMNYYHKQESLTPDHGRVARYAYGRDYHKIIGKKLKQLEKFIMGEAELPLSANPLTKSYVDTGPVMERALAEQAGLGRIGKNGCLITKEFGSWVFLSEIITTLDLNFSSPPDSPTPQNPSPGITHDSSPAISSDRWSNPQEKSFNVCGNCRKCITSCPTGAIIAPGVVDSRLCISYLTIENKKKIPPKLAKLIKKTQRLFGCDICQEVCPHNHARQRTSTNTELSTPKIGTDEIPLKSVQQIKTDEQFLKTFAGSPLMRAKTKGLKRNAEIISL